MSKKLVLSILFIFALFVSATFINIVSADTKAEDTAPQASTTIVISQVYGGGGGASGTYKYDYIELLNISRSPVSLNGLAIQYGAATGDFGGNTGSNVFALPNVTLQPGQHFLIQTGTVGSGGADFPATPDAVATLSLSGSSGKVALTNTTTALGCGGTTACASSDARIIDLVSYGAANNGEGGTTVNNGTALSSTQGAVRNGNGCTDTDNNNNNFTVATNPVPRNMASAATPCSANPQPTPTARAILDFTGDGRSDWATVTNYFSTTAGLPITWKVTGNPASAAPNAAFIRRFDYGLNTDTIVAADYIGDLKTEPTVWRPGTPGIFYVAQFPTGTAGIMLDRAIPFGASTDLAVEGGDYDGDGKADYTVVRLNADNSLTWFIRSSATGTDKAINFGNLTGIQYARIFPGADFNGDGRDEIVFATADPTTGSVTYYAGDTVTGLDVMIRKFGNYNSDYSMPPADYTGDHKADFVAVRQTSGGQVWYINNSATNVTTAQQFGIPDSAAGGRGDIQVRGDYDGDGIQDICVWRPSNQTFYYLKSSSNNTVVDGQKHGDPGDFPLGALSDF